LPPDPSKLESLGVADVPTLPGCPRPGGGVGAGARPCRRRRGQGGGSAARIGPAERRHPVDRRQRPGIPREKAEPSRHVERLARRAGRGKLLPSHHCRLPGGRRGRREGGREGRKGASSAIIGGFGPLRGTWLGEKGNGPCSLRQPCAGIEMGRQKVFMHKGLCDSQAGRVIRPPCLGWRSTRPANDSFRRGCRRPCPAIIIPLPSFPPSLPPSLPQGVASLASGQLDLLLQRRLLFDDRRGVNEPLNETVGGIEHGGDWARRGEGVRVRGKHTLMLGAAGREGMRELRVQMDEAFFPASLFFSTQADLLASPSLAASPSPSPSAPPSRLSFLPSELPPSLALLTLQYIHPRERWTTRTDSREGGEEGGGEDGCAPRFLLRLAHQFAVDEDPEELSQPVTVDLASLFPRYALLSSTELTLSAGQPKSELQRLSWKTTEGAFMGGREGGHGGGQVVTLGPMEIRTFEVVLGMKVEGKKEVGGQGGGEGRKEGGRGRWRAGPAGLLATM
ncbi:lysosomal alpha, partial [Nannochloropsis gaditana]